MTAAAVAMFLLVGLVIYVLWRDVEDAPDYKPVDTDKQWGLAAANGTQLDRLMIRAARPLADAPSIYERAMSPQYRWLQAKLLASGGVFGGSVEVLIAMTVVATLAGFTALALTLALTDGFFPLAIAVLFAVSLTSYPYTQVNKAAKSRTSEITTTLPIFADLLQMPLSAGVGVWPSIAFTTNRMRPGVVRTEMETMLDLQRSRSVTDEEAFLYAAERLGTPEAKAFMTALMQAATRGTKVLENIDKQAENLRAKAVELRLQFIERLPSKVSTIIAVTMMPVLLLVVLVPVGVSLGGL